MREEVISVHLPLVSLCVKKRQEMKRRTTRETVGDSWIEYKKRERDWIKRVKPWLNRVKVMDRQREKKEKKPVSPVHKKQEKRKGERIECSWHETNETLLVWDKEWWWCQWLFDFSPGSFLHSVDSVCSFCPRFRRETTRCSFPMYSSLTSSFAWMTGFLTFDSRTWLLWLSFYPRPFCFGRGCEIRRRYPGIKDQGDDDEESRYLCKRATFSSVVIQSETGSSCCFTKKERRK